MTRINGELLRHQSLPSLIQINALKLRQAQHASMGSVRHKRDRMLDRLTEDHHNVFQLLELLDATMRRVERDEDANLSAARDIMFYMTRYPDLFHHPREELLFRRLAIADPQARRLIEELRYEHGILAESGRDLHNLVSNAASGREVEENLLTAKANSYSDMLRDHMRKEESGILPLSRIVLSGADWEALTPALTMPADPLFGDQVERGFIDLRRSLLSRGTNSKS